MADASRRPARLLVVDDNKVNRLLLTRSLELQGHSVAAADNGRVALEMLRKARKNSPFTIHLTYPVAEIDAGRKADWQMQQAKERAKKKKNGKIKVREDWAPAKHAIAPVLAQLAAGQNIVIGDGAAAHVIDLGDPLGY